MERTKLNLNALVAVLHLVRGALTMEMKRWSTRWKTKRWLWDCSVTTLVTLMVILQADDARAGKT